MAFSVLILVWTIAVNTVTILLNFILYHHKTKLIKKIHIKVTISMLDVELYIFDSESK